MSQPRGDGEGGGEGDYLCSAAHSWWAPALSTPSQASKRPIHFFSTIPKKTLLISLKYLGKIFCNKYSYGRRTNSPFYLVRSGRRSSSLVVKGRIRGILFKMDRICQHRLRIRQKEQKTCRRTATKLPMVVYQLV